MRVLHVIPSLSLTEGGPSFAAKAMADALAGEGVEVTIATTRGSRERLSDHMTTGQQDSETAESSPRRVRRNADMELATASPSDSEQGARSGKTHQKSDAATVLFVFGGSS